MSARLFTLILCGAIAPVVIANELHAEIRPSIEMAKARSTFFIKNISIPDISKNNYGFFPSENIFKFFGTNRPLGIKCHILMPSGDYHHIACRNYRCCVSYIGTWQFINYSSFYGYLYIVGGGMPYIPSSYSSMGTFFQFPSPNTTWFDSYVGAELSLSVAFHSSDCIASGLSGDTSRLIRTKQEKPLNSGDNSQEASKNSQPFSIKRDPLVNRVWTYFFCGILVAVVGSAIIAWLDRGYPYLPRNKDDDKYKSCDRRRGRNTSKRL